MMRATAKLSGKLERKLVAYATAASAAGISVLTMAQVAESKVIYTPVHKVLRNPSHYDLDLNADGIRDFVINNNSSCSYLGCLFYLDAFGEPAAGNGIATNRGFHSAAALHRGAVIGPKNNFDTCCYLNLAAVSNSRTQGNWVNVKNRYLGLKFTVDSDTHYGWARLSVSVQGSEIVGTLTGYAYETIPDKAIIAGNRGSTTGAGPEAAPARLGHLALGAAGTRPQHRGVETSH